MKSGDFQRSVSTTRHDRVAGSAPSLGRVAKMPGTGLPKGERRKRKISESSGGKRSEGGRLKRLRQRQRRTLRWWSLGILVAACSSLTLLIWLGMADNSEFSEKSGNSPNHEQANASTHLDKVQVPSPSEASALAFVRQGLENRDPAQVHAYFHPCSTSPPEVVDFLKTLETSDGAIESFSWLSSVDANGLSIDGVLANFRSEDKPRNRVALLTPDAAGTWKINYDAFARTISSSWKSLIESSDGVAQVRVYAAKDSYFNGPFKDDSQWICYGMATPDVDQILIGYCKLGSAQAAAMDWIFSKGNLAARVTLEIRRVAGADVRQFEISKVLAEDWVMGPAPFDEGFK